MDKALRGYLAELAGTFVLVFFCAAIVCVSYLRVTQGAPPLGLVGIALAQGAAYAALLSATVLVSEGCLNPAVTLVLWVIKRFDGRQTLALIAVQLIGAAAAGGLVTAIFSPEVLAEAHAGTPHLRAFRDTLVDGGLGVSALDLLVGILVEAALTFLLTLTLFATVFDPRRPRLGGLIPGLALTAAVLTGYHLTGAAVNPARWFGPAVWQGTVPTLGGQSVLADHVVYWMGPIVGGLLAGILYSTVLMPPLKNNH